MRVWPTGTVQHSAKLVGASFHEPRANAVCAIKVVDRCCGRDRAARAVETDEVAVTPVPNPLACAIVCNQREL